ncbi:FadR/GntR family transcriptional regulator [Microbacterium sp. NPDC087591]|uniref:FadR/GntR family transcriptional regulator n=1 Tax=Microbacterium sp. NPDC087591 TaxID=3364192 RepID=UPI003801E878
MAEYPGRGLHGEVVEQLGLRIVRGDYAPGTRIDVEALEPELGVSKSVVREALRVIREKGLIDSWQKRGTFVTSRESWKLLDTDVMMWRREAQRDDDQLLVDLSQLRDAIEPAAAGLAASHRTAEDLARLDAAFAAFQAAGENVDRLAEADLDFHLLILGATHNELFVRLDTVVIHALSARNRIQHHPGARWHDPVPDHRAVLEAIRQGSVPIAEAAMRYALRESDQDLTSGEPPFDLGHA